jgi:glycosyl hydrolase family 59 (putative galactocerebrosidase)
VNFIETVAAAVLALIALPVAGQAQIGAVQIDLSKMEPGRPPQDFDTSRTGHGAPATWVVVTDATAASGRAIAQTSTDRTDYRFPLAVYQPISPKDVEVTVRFKSLAGKVDQAGGIAVRLTTPDDYYVVRANALEDNVRFYRVVKGNRQQIAGADTKVASGEWHTLTLKAQGDRFTVSFDGKQLYTTEDKTFGNPGKIALWTKADSVTHFDRIAITTLQ